MDNYVVTVEPEATPVSLEDAKDWLRVEDTEDDRVIGALVSAASSWVEKYTNLTLMPQTYEGFFDCLQISKYENFPFVRIRRAPFVTLTSVEVDEGSGMVTVPVSGYQLKEGAGFPTLVFISTVQPSRAAAAYPIKVTFTVGYPSDQQVPQSIKIAILQYVAFLYENRGDAQAIGEIGMPQEARTLLNKYRIINTFG